MKAEKVQPNQDVPKPNYDKIREIAMDKPVKGRVKENSVYIDITNRPKFTNDLYYDSIHDMNKDIDDMRKEISTINRELKNMKAKSWKRYKIVSKFK